MIEKCTVLGNTILNHIAHYPLHAPSVHMVRCERHYNAIEHGAAVWKVTYSVSHAEGHKDFKEVNLSNMIAAQSYSSTSSNT